MVRCNPVADAGYLELTEYTSVPDGIGALITPGGSGGCDEGVTRLAPPGLRVRQS